MAQNLFYQRGLRKVLSTPTEVRAIPTTEETTMTHIGGQAKQDAATVARSKSRGFRRKRLADVMRFRRKELSVAEEQGKTATKIELANLGLTGIAGWQNIQESQRQGLIFDEMANLNRELVSIKRRHYEELLSH